jgi:hypothetical protein
MGGGAALLSSQGGLKGVDATCCPGCPPDWCQMNGPDSVVVAAGDWESSNGRRKLLDLKEGASGVEGKVVVGNRASNTTTTTELFVATNAANFPKGSLSGTLRLAIPDSKDCTTEAYKKALAFQLNDPVEYVVNEPAGRIGGKDGWLKQSISKIQGANSTLPVSLTDLISGVETEYSLAAYLLSSDEELLACANLKKVDEDTAAEYYELFYGSSDGEAVKGDTASSGSKKSGVFVFASAIAAVGIAVVLGEVLAL